MVRLDDKMKSGDVTPREEYLTFAALKNKLRQEHFHEEFRNVYKNYSS